MPRIVPIELLLQNKYNFIDILLTKNYDALEAHNIIYE